MQQINTPKAPSAIGPYSQGIVSGKMVFTSGQIPVDPATGQVVGDNVKAQAEQVMKNLSGVLEAGGASLKNVVKTTCYLADMGDFGDFNTVYAEAFQAAGATVTPARSCVAVKTLPKNVLCEVEALAIVE